MDKLTQNQKLKLLLLLFFTNVSVFLFSSSEDNIDLSKNRPQLILRENYSEVLVTGKLLTSFQINKPVSILSQNKKLYIPYGVLTQRIVTTQQEDFNQSNKTNDYLIYVPNKFIPNLVSIGEINILPYGKDYRPKEKSHGEKFEISI